MSQLNFGIRIGAQDDSQSTLRGAMAGFRSFAKTISKPITIPLKIGHGGLKLLRDINLGLAPLVRGLDNVIERGTGLEVVRKSFESLTGKSGRQADILGRRMVQAASGTLRLSQAMQIANRAVASGISFKQLTVAMDFVSKKAITTGMSAETAIDKVITGLSRGSTLFLDDFGILVDGIEGIERGYNKLHGSGAWDSLAPAAKKAETIRQAVAEMGGQLGRIGVTGKETVFVFQPIKNSIGDATDKLFAAVGRSDSLKSALQGIRDTIGGMTKHIEGGGSLTDILFGKKEGESGGLFGFLKAGALDIGIAFGQGAVGVLFKSLAGLIGAFKSTWTWLKTEALGLWDTLGQKIKKTFSEIREPWESMFKGILSDLSGALGPLGRLMSITGRSTSQPASATDGIVQAGVKGAVEALPKVIAGDAARSLGARGAAAAAGAASRQIAADRAAQAAAGRMVPLAGDQIAKGAASAGLASKAGKGALGFVAKRAVPIAAIADFALTLYQFARAIKGYSKASDELQDTQDMLKRQREMLRKRGFPVAAGPMTLSPALSAALAVNASAIGMTPSKGEGFLKVIAEWWDKIGPITLSGGGGGRGLAAVLNRRGDALLGDLTGGGNVRKWQGAFQRDFPPHHDVKTAPADDDVDPFTGQHKRNILRDIEKRKEKIRQIKQGNLGVKQEARRRAAREADRLRGEGKRVSKSREGEIFRDILKEMIDKLVKKEMDAIKRREQELAKVLESERRIRDRRRKDRDRQHMRGKPAWERPERVQGEPEEDAGLRLPKRRRRGPTIMEDGAAAGTAAQGQGSKEEVAAAEKTADAVERLEALAGQVAGLLAAGVKELTGAKIALGAIGRRRH